MPTRARHVHTEAFSEIRQLCLFKEQVLYELWRPVVLFGDTSAERAAETGFTESTIRRQTAQFEREGMAAIFRPTQRQQADAHRSLLPPIRQEIVDLKIQYPPFSLREIAQICYVKYNRRPSHHTIKQILAAGPPPTTRERAIPRYDDIADPFQRRKQVIVLHWAGWPAKCIAGYLEVPRSTVYAILKRFKKEDVAGMHDKSRANTRVIRKVDMTTKQAIRAIQENPEIGEFRMHAALKRLGIHISSATCGRVMAENRQLYGLASSKHTPKAPKEHPYKGLYRHHVWSVDVRYIEHHQIPEIKGPFYIISILDNFSRAILSSMVAQRQDLTAYLLVLFAAIRQHGAPTTLVSDSGAIFKAKQAQQVYAFLEIEKRQIASGQPWMNLIESQFNLQRRLADHHFAQVTTWEQAQTVHEQWMTEHNYQLHWAHRKRDDGKHSPAEVLGWVHGRVYDEQRLHQVFYSHQFRRAINRLGYVCFRNFRLYGEVGLAGQEATLWLYGETLTLEFANNPLTQYRVTYQPDKKHFKQVTDPQRFQTPYHSPQMDLWELSGITWQLVKRLDEYAAHHRHQTNGSPVLQLSFW